jgi:putative membrane protein
MGTSEYRRNSQWALVWVIVLLAIIAFIVASSLVFRPPGYYSWYPFSFGWIWVPFAFFFLFFGLRWYFWPWGWGDRRRYRNGEDAYFVLRERFARGEITREQFEQMSRDLQEHERT